MDSFTHHPIIIVGKWVPGCRLSLTWSARLEQLVVLLELSPWMSLDQVQALLARQPTRGSIAPQFASKSSGERDRVCVCVCVQIIFISIYIYILHDWNYLFADLRIHYVLYKIKRRVSSESTHTAVLPPAGPLFRCQAGNSSHLSSADKTRPNPQIPQIAPQNLAKYIQISNLKSCFELDPSLALHTHASFCSIPT